ncbi:MAG: hypothetical protein AB1551_06270 [Actinomycetota bacterium]
MRPLRIGLLIAGIIVDLIALALVVGGVFLLWAHTTQRDAAGYYSTGPHEYSTPGYALTSVEVDLGVHAKRWLPSGLGTVRFSVDAAQEQPLFVGIGRQSAVDAYLADVDRSVVTDVELSPFRVEYERVSGDTKPAPPSQQDFWAAEASGSGGTTLTWSIRSGSWMLVVMNADGSRGVDAQLSIGAKTGILLPIGIAILVVGVLLGSGAALMVFLAVRRPRQQPSTLPPPPPRRDI